jgi:hypothetical protein
MRGMLKSHDERINTESNTRRSVMKKLILEELMPSDEV